MNLILKTLLMMSFSMVSASSDRPIIDLPSDYNPASPWKQLAKLGLTNLTETDCERTCIAGETPRVCLYTFVLEHYAAMGTACGDCAQGVLEDCFQSQCIPMDGQERGVMSINRMIPGPPINVCKNDVLVVDVQNKMVGSEDSIHWHGLEQKNSQWMDGVPFVTQCPISDGHSFRYVFSADEVGTHFYHSHSGLHMVNGIFGAFVVREPREKESWSKDAYDFDRPEHTMVISDWQHETAEMSLPGLPTAIPSSAPASYLFNGLGRYLHGSNDDEYFNVSHPLKTFHVQKNKRYRFRIINAGSMACPVVIQIEDHNMTVIATDGRPIEPVIVDAVVSHPAERFDIVINTDIESEKKAFWIHLRGLHFCESLLNLQQYAILSYDDDVSESGIVPEGDRPTMAEPLPYTTIVNDIGCGDSTSSLCISDLQSIGEKKNENILTAEPDHRLIISFGFHEFEDVNELHESGKYLKYMNFAGQTTRSGVVNDITFKFPSKPSLFMRNSTESEFCSSDNLPARCATNGKNESKPYCECPQVVEVKENDIVELTFVNEEYSAIAVDHPMHLHGYSFYVVHVHYESDRTESYTRDEIEDILRNKAAKTSRDISPAMKDTVGVPRNGFITVRFQANNPGDWLMHCHLEWHMNVGMKVLLRVKGELAQTPPGFPTCGNFDPLLQY